MNELASLGLILLVALAAGHIVTYLRIPEITGYILAGIALGPSVLGWVSHNNLQALSVFSEVALGFILFSIGFVFTPGNFRRIGRGVILVTLSESGSAALLVILTMLLLGQPWPVALLLGAIAIETAVASTVMVIRELDSTGPLTDTLSAVMAVNNVFCLLAFGLVATLLDVSTGSGPFARILYHSSYLLVWQVAGSIALGYLCGIMLAGWASRIVEHGETTILLAGAILFCVGASAMLDLSPLLASLSIGATIANLSGRSKTLFQALTRTDPPLYAIFFVIAGADMNLGLLTTIGFIGLSYTVARALGKFFGSRLGAWKAGLDPIIRKWLGFGLMTQAGLAIGLTLVIQRRFPNYAATVNTVVLASIIVYEMIGPIATRFALVNSGEAAAAPAAIPAPHA